MIGDGGWRSWLVIAASVVDVGRETNDGNDVGDGS